MAKWTCFLQFCVLSTGLLTSADERVFRSQLEAHTVLQRPRRSNTFLFEEILPGNLERECFEERCNYEEAREYFENTPKTVAFWAAYKDGDQCKPNPCLNGGICTDKFGGYSCECEELYDGVNCERDVSQCPSEGPRSCDHFCRPSFHSYHCTCAKGYRLDEDRRTCLPEVQHPCGRAPVPKISQPNWTDPGFSPASELCAHGRCPWQVSLLDTERREICSGVILGHRSILTAATCVSRSDTILVASGEQRVDRGQQAEAWPGEEQPPPPRGPGEVTPVSRVSVHKRYRLGDAGDDLAFLQLHRPIRFGAAAFQACVPEKDFSENVLMEPGRGGWAAGRGAGGKPDSLHRLTYLPLEDCQSSLNLSFPLTNKMFCMAGWGGDGGCGLPPGTPVVSARKSTVFLTGLITSAETHNCSQGHVFTKLSRYLPWIHQQLELAEK